LPVAFTPAKENDELAFTAAGSILSNDIIIFIDYQEIEPVPPVKRYTL